MAKVSHAITITFGTSAWTASITDVDPPGGARGSLDTSHQGTTNWMTFIAEELADRGELAIGFQYEPSETALVPFTAAAETITIRFGDDGDNVSFSGFFTDVKNTGPHGQLMTGTATIKVSGNVSYSTGTGTGA